jgi:hypothetical protein
LEASRLNPGQVYEQPRSVPLTIRRRSGRFSGPHSEDKGHPERTTRLMPYEDLLRRVFVVDFENDSGKLLERSSYRGRPPEGFRRGQDQADDHGLSGPDRHRTAAARIAGFFDRDEA